MANRAQAQYLRIFDEVATYARFQSYYIGQVVTWESASWSYHPFAANGMIGGTPGTNVGVSVEIPATATAVNIFKLALANNYLCELQLYEFSSSLSQVIVQSTQLLIGIYVGEVTSIGGSFTSMQVSLGSSLAPVGAQAPPRKFSSLLIGAPIRS